MISERPFVWFLLFVFLNKVPLICIHVLLLFIKGTNFMANTYSCIIFDISASECVQGLDLDRHHLHILCLLQSRQILWTCGWGFMIMNIIAIFAIIVIFVILVIMIMNITPPHTTLLDSLREGLKKSHRIDLLRTGGEEYKKSTHTTLADYLGLSCSFSVSRTHVWILCLRQILWTCLYLMIVSSIIKINIIMIIMITTCISIHSLLMVASIQFHLTSTQKFSVSVSHLHHTHHQHFQHWTLHASTFVPSKRWMSGESRHHHHHNFHHQQYIFLQKEKRQENPRMKNANMSELAENVSSLVCSNFFF